MTSDLQEKKLTTVHTDAGVETRARKPSGFGVTAEKYGLLVVLLALIIVFAVGQQAFMTVANWQAIASSLSVSIVISLALLLPIIAGKFDLSVGSIAVLSSLIGAKLMAENHLSLGISIAVALVIGVIIGAVNGFIVTVLGVNDFVATLGSSTILLGVISWYSNDSSVSNGLSPALLDFGIARLFGVPWVTICSLLLAVVIGYVVRQTPFGRQLISIGSNSKAATLVGVRVDRNVRVTYVTSGLLGSLAGIVMIAQQGSATSQINGLNLLIPALAAIFLGASAFNPGQFNVLGTIVGLLLVAVAVSGLTLAGAPSWVSSVVNGLLLILAVAGSKLFKRRRGGRTA